MTKNKKFLLLSIVLLSAFALWTLLLKFADVNFIGPENSAVGFSKINGYVHQLFGVNMKLYVITDWLGLVPVFVAFGFAVLGFIQLIKRKNIFKVDFDILALGVFYIITIAFYIIFEEITVNFRPVLINGILETSYPSSTTLLTLCVMSTAFIQFNFRIKKVVLKNIINFINIAFIAFMVIGRMISGVHWFTDIIGGVLLSGGLITMYYSAVLWKSN